MLSVILIIGGVTVAVGLLCYSHEILQRKKHHHASAGNDAAAENPEAPGAVAQKEPETEVCCGLHAVCEKMYGVSGKVSPEYYDDEELDLLAGRDPEGYSNAEREFLREVMLTLLPSDRPGWAKSLEMRRIQLPADLRDELLMLLAEA